MYKVKVKTTLSWTNLLFTDSPRAILKATGRQKHRIALSFPKPGVIMTSGDSTKPLTHKTKNGTHCIWSGKTTHLCLQDWKKNGCLVAASEHRKQSRSIICARQFVDSVPFVTELVIEAQENLSCGSARVSGHIFKAMP